MVPSFTAELISQAKQLSAEGRALLKQAMQANFDEQLLRNANTKLNEALTLVPNLGVAWNILGNIAQFTRQPQSIVSKYSLRGIANNLKTPEDEDRIVRARMTYAGFFVVWRLRRGAATVTSHAE